MLAPKDFYSLFSALIMKWSFSEDESQCEEGYVFWL